MARIPIGVELVRKGVVSDSQIRQAIEYQRLHPGKKLGDIIYLLNLANEEQLASVMSEIFGFPSIILDTTLIALNPRSFYSLDIAKETRSLPFEIEGDRCKVAFADPNDKNVVKQITLLLMGKGFQIEPYLAFESNILDVISSLEGSAETGIDESSDITSLIDTIIKSAMEKRASDIHIEPLEKVVRIRYRIDGRLITVATIDKRKQNMIVGRIKAISNMHQEKQLSQDGRILLYSDYNIRVSSQKNVHGEKIVLRLLKKNEGIRDIFDLGFPKDPGLVKRAFDKRNSITLMAAPTGEGKTTTLYSVLEFLNNSEINVTTIEDPVEIRVEGINQIEVDENISFADSLRTVLRQDPDIILVGEIRDRETAEIAMQAGQTGHYVLSTIHTIDAVEVITRLRKIGVSNYDIASTLATSISQRLVRRVCQHCAKKRDFTKEEKELMQKTIDAYDVKLDFKDKFTYEVKGCKECNFTGYLERIALFEILLIDDDLSEAIMENESTIVIRNMALAKEYKPLVVDGMQKVIEGITTLDEINTKLAFY